jgi:hypothetical protein
MATAAQVKANQANAQYSTGPQTPEGKSRAARNNVKHGLTLGVLTLSPEEQAPFSQFEANLRAELNPVSALECEALQQFLDAAARLQRIKGLIAEMLEKHAEEPLLLPETEAELRQLTRYRAAAEMIAYRAVRTLRELRTTRLFRAIHLTPAEQAQLPSLAKPATKMKVNGQMLGRNDRELLELLRRGTVSSSSNPIPPQQKQDSNRPRW